MARLQIPLRKELLDGIHCIQQRRKNPHQYDTFDQGFKAGIAVGVTLASIALLSFLLFNIIEVPKTPEKPLENSQYGLNIHALTSRPLK